MPGCWLHTPGGWLGIAVTPPLSHSSAEQGAPGTATPSAKSAEDPRKPLGVGRCDPASMCTVCKEGRSSGRGGVAVIFGVPPPSYPSLGRWEQGVTAGRAHQPSPRTCYRWYGVWGPACSPMGASGIPLPPAAPMGPPRPSPGALPPPLVLPVPRLSLPRVFLRVFCPLSSPRGINHPPAPASRRKQPPALPPPSHGTRLPLGGWESVPRPEGVRSENLSGTV